MDKVPNTITSKDLAYITDMLNWNYVLIKKCDHYQNIIEQDKINTVVCQVSSVLEKNYLELLEMLEEE